VLAAVFAIMLWPVQKRITRAFRGRSGWAALICSLLVLLLLVPLFFVGSVVAKQAMETYGLLQDDIQAMLRGDTPPFIAKLQQSPWYGRFGLDRFDWQTTLRDLARGSGAFAGRVLSRTSRGTLGAVASLFITVFTLFYFLADGERLIANLRRISPCAPTRPRPCSSVSAPCRAPRARHLRDLPDTGDAGRPDAVAAGRAPPLLWSVVMLVLAFVPTVGTAVVLAAALFQILTGSVWQGIAILLVSFGVIFNVDNLMRPRLMGRGGGMHDHRLLSPPSAARHLRRHGLHRRTDRGRSSSSRCSTVGGAAGAASTVGAGRDLGARDVRPLHPQRSRRAGGRAVRGRGGSRRRAALQHRPRPSRRRCRRAAGRRGDSICLRACASWRRRAPPARSTPAPRASCSSRPFATASRAPLPGAGRRLLRMAGGGRSAAKSRITCARRRRVIALPAFGTRAGTTAATPSARPSPSSPPMPARSS
jgi:hypothetical protein